MCATFVIFKLLPKVNNHTLGKNPPYQVPLIAKMAGRNM
jgi:hypothetical protein